MGVQVGTIDADIFQCIDEVEQLNGLAALKKLQSHFQASTPAKIRVLILDLLLRQLRSVDIPLNDALQSVILLNGLDSSFSTVKPSLLLRDDLTSTTIRKKLIEHASSIQ
eukprot:CAMPEP_0197539774 /NCGR_PEP_ID=MMETSP1318-20131121/63758_1 /TAXON_ID=552666 /ORGANISM="Partenskyella glossopodia, Strain RCC365" /LENGTH=109 /DNA_ID=CAMNT_0043098571 /DNA_START=255 /DNA_END=582 /DNA_ORIENTATION=+